MCAGANGSRDAKCAACRDANVKTERQLLQRHNITVLARRLYINEGRILRTVAKFTTEFGMQEAAAIWEVSSHIKASIW